MIGKKNNNSVKFKFTKNCYRNYFKQEANRFLPENSWKKISESDNDPAIKK